MPRFFFDTTSDAEMVVDDVGFELISTDAAREQALAGLRDLIHQGHPTLGANVSVRDEQGHVIYSAALQFTESFGDVVASAYDQRGT